MHTEMWEHASVQENLATLRRRGVHVVDPESGRLAGGDIGSGRLASPEMIVERAQRLLAPQDMAGLKVLVTAGGTREPIDAVRVIANRSSGKQGHALAFEAAARGAVVTVVTTVPRAVPTGAEVVSVETAAEMEEAVMARAATTDVVVMAAAVADFRPKAAVDHKIKKDGGPPEIILEPTPDILAALGARQARGPDPRRFRRRDRSRSARTRSRSSAASTSTSSSPTTSPRPARASSTTRTRS